MPSSRADGTGFPRAVPERRAVRRGRRCHRGLDPWRAEFRRPAAARRGPARIAADPGAVPELLADSGVRRGSDVLKHRAFGASAVQLGRAPLRDLAGGGEAGAAALPAMAEMRAAMGFLGVRRLADLSAKAKAGQPRAQEREHADMIPGGPAGAVRKWNVPQKRPRSPSLHRGRRDRAQPWAVRTASMLDSARRGAAFMTWPGSSLPRIRSAVRAASISLPRSIPVGKPDSSHR
ncbi:hypothetical protein EQ718_11375 [Paracoccus versutus]|nr:hypothetical protein EQ718_11375 [Paracoccus versutus]